MFSTRNFNRSKPVLFIFNKIDLLKKEELIQIYKTKKMQSEFMSNLVTLEISAINKQGFNKVFDTTNKLIDLSQKNTS